MSMVQIEQDFALCNEKFKSLTCRAIGAQFTANDVIALFEFESGEKGITLANERHYRLANPQDITADDLKSYAIQRELP